MLVDLKQKWVSHRIRQTHKNHHARCLLWQRIMTGPSKMRNQQSFLLQGLRLQQIKASKIIYSIGKRSLSTSSLTTPKGSN